jgi:mannose-6-phosphate isomerase-like protein (cupin superfamily)
LKLILDAIPMTFGEFFTVSDTLSDKIVYRTDEMIEISPLRVLSNKTMAEVDGFSFRQVGRSGDYQIQMLHESYEPGADTGEELYRHESEEAGIVVSGEIELTVGDAVATLSAGDGYIFDSRKPHRFRNTGTVRCTIVSACTPPTF